MTYYNCVRHSKLIHLKQYHASGVHIADKPLPPLGFATVKSTSDLDNYLIKLTISPAYAICKLGYLYNIGMRSYMSMERGALFRESDRRFGEDRGSCGSIVHMKGKDKFHTVNIRALSSFTVPNFPYLVCIICFTNSLPALFVVGI